ncbi:MAG: TetR/AcrR family transcriptional regulator [Pseudomonas sp.]
MTVRGLKPRFRFFDSIGSGRDRVMAEAKPKVSASVNVERRAKIGEEKRARTRSKILETAFHLIGREKGRFTLVDEVCQQSGISRGTFYNYFNGVEELFEALCYELSHDFNNSVLALVAEMGSDVERVSAAVRYYLGRAITDKPWGWAMVNISISGYIFGIETYKHAESTIKDGIESGVFKVKNLSLGRDVLLGATFGAMITCLRGGADENYPSEIAQEILLGLGVASDLASKVVTIRLVEPNG